MTNYEREMKGGSEREKRESKGERKGEKDARAHSAHITYYIAINFFIIDSSNWFMGSKPLF